LEVTVRNARLTDVDAAVRVLAQGTAPSDVARDAADHLRHLLFIPAATVIVATAGRQLLAVGILSIRPSVRSGPFVGVIDDLGVAGQEPGSDGAAEDTPRRDDVAGRVLEHLIASARNKGCSRVEVTDPLASAEPALLERNGFRPRGVLLSRAIGPTG
jgi:hypothetical protein